MKKKTNIEKKNKKRRKIEEKKGKKGK